MTKAPTRRRSPAKRPATRLPGPATPASAAATAAATPRSFYDPEGPAPRNAGPGETTGPEAPAPDLQSAYGDAAQVSDGVGADVEFAGVKDGETLEQAIARIRETRKPLGAFTQKLAYAKRPGYYRHWFNDSPGRVEEARQAGWSHVQGSDRKPVARHVGSGRDDKGLSAFLMEIPDIIHREDQQEFHDMARSRIDSLKAAPFRAQPGQATAADKGKFYDPHEESGAGPLQVVKH